MTYTKDRYKHDREVTIAEESKKDRQKNSQNRGQKNHCKEKAHGIPVKAAVSEIKGSDLLLFASNKSAGPAARPQLLRDGQTVYLREQRRLA